MSRRFRHWLKRFRRDRRGNPAVEFALFAPVLVLMFAALLEIGNLLMVHLKVWHSTVTVGDLATRTEEISEGEITDLYRVVEQVMKPYVTGGDKSLFIVTAVSRLADGDPDPTDDGVLPRRQDARGEIRRQPDGAGTHRGDGRAESFR